MQFALIAQVISRLQPAEAVLQSFRLPALRRTRALMFMTRKHESFLRPDGRAGNQLADVSADRPRRKQQSLRRRRLPMQKQFQQRPCCL